MGKTLLTGKKRTDYVIKTKKKTIKKTIGIKYYVCYIDINKDNECRYGSYNVALVANCNYISQYIKKRIVHNDFTNFCNTMNKARMCVQIVFERGYAIVDVTSYSHRHKHSLLTRCRKYILFEDSIFSICMKFSMCNSTR